MQSVTKVLSIKELQSLADQMYGNLVKGVVDIDKKILIINGALHADLEQFLLDQGSSQKNLWGINLHPNQYNSENFIEYDSMINLRPNQNNHSRGVDDPSIRLQIKQIILPLFSE